MSKLLSEEIVEAVTLGDKEGFMSAFHSALAAKVSDALEIKKVEIASTLIAPASSEVVEEEVEQIDELSGREGGILDRYWAAVDRLDPGKTHHPDGSYTLHGYDKKSEQNPREAGRQLAIKKLVQKRGYRSAWNAAHPDANSQRGNQPVKVLATKSYARNEEVEQIDELSAGLLHRYRDASSNTGDYGTSHVDGNPRRKSIVLAGQKLNQTPAYKKHYDDYVASKNTKESPHHVPVKVLATKSYARNEEAEEIEEAKGETRISWRARTPEEIAKSDKRRKVKVTSAELEARARARRAEKSE
jgi:hypothetical protein